MISIAVAYYSLWRILFIVSNKYIGSFAPSTWSGDSSTTRQDNHFRIQGNIHIAFWYVRYVEKSGTMQNQPYVIYSNYVSNFKTVPNLIPRVPLLALVMLCLPCNIESLIHVDRSVAYVVVSIQVLRNSNKADTPCSC